MSRNQCAFIESIDYSIPPCYPSDEEWEKIKKHIVKHSPNIIDLIEVGDYVNGYIIEKIGEAGFGKLAYWKQYDRKWTYIDENDIKTIVTKELFKNSEYEV